MCRARLCVETWVCPFRGPQNAWCPVGLALKPRTNRPDILHGTQQGGQRKEIPPKHRCHATPPKQNKKKTAHPLDAPKMTDPAIKKNKHDPRLGDAPLQSQALGRGALKPRPQLRQPGPWCGEARSGPTKGPPAIPHKLTRRQEHVLGRPFVAMGQLGLWLPHTHRSAGVPVQN